MKINFTALSLFISIFSFSQGINTMERNDAGQSTDSKSGFYQTYKPINYPPGAQVGHWYHLIDVRHTDLAYNYAMQFSGQFADQKLFFRKTNNNPAQPWSKILMENPSGNVGIGTENPQAKLDINGNLRIVNNVSDHTFVSLGKELNDQIITDNTSAKHYGGGYFFRVHNENIAYKYIDALKISDNGNVAVANKLEAKEVKVTTTPTADFVFAEDYNLPKLEEVEKYIKDKKHLPEIASAKEMEKEGVNVGEFQIKLLQKIEELTLYSIEQNKRIKNLEEKLLKNNK